MNDIYFLLDDLSTLFGKMSALNLIRGL